MKDFFVSIPRKQANENQATIVDIIIGPFFLTIVLFYIFFSCVILNWSYWENLLPVNQQTNIWQQQQKTTTTINRRMKTNRWKLTPCIQQCDFFRKFVLTSSLFFYFFCYPELIIWMILLLIFLTDDKCFPEEYRDVLRHVCAHVSEVHSPSGVCLLCHYQTATGSK